MTKKCWCGFEGEPLVGPGKGEHYAEYRCPNCKGHLGWMKKPDNEKPKREKSHTELVKEFSRGFCEMCGILESRIPKGEAMVAHHVVEYRNNGSPDRANIWILCSACHRLVHWHRTYKKHLIPEHFYAVDQNPEQIEGIETVDQLELDTPGEESAEENAFAVKR